MVCVVQVFRVYHWSARNWAVFELTYADQRDRAVIGGGQDKVATIGERSRGRPWIGRRTARQKSKGGTASDVFGICTLGSKQLKARYRNANSWTCPFATGRAVVREERGEKRDRKIACYQPVSYDDKTGGLC